MNRPETWRPVLDAEIERWEANTHEQLIAELEKTVTYEVEFDSKKYQVEVQFLENTDRYLHIGVAVDDASLWGAMRPLSSSFIKQK